jgi:hypothetical protein
MKFLKIVLNCILSLSMPGILLISKKHLSGYFIYFLYLINLSISTFTRIIYSYFGLIFLSVEIILIVLSIFYYLSNLKLLNNRKLYIFLIILTFLIQLPIFLTKTNNNLFHVRNSISLKPINDKIASLEKLGTTDYSPFSVPLLNSVDPNYVLNIPVKIGIRKYDKWKPGIYCMLLKDSIFAAYLNVNRRIESCPDLVSLRKQLLLNNINIDTIPFYFAYSMGINDDSLKTALVKVKKAGIKSLKVIFIKDSANIEHLAFDSANIANIKSIQEKLIGKGKSPAVALAEAIVPSITTCPPFMIDIDNIVQINADERFAALIKALKKDENCNNCNIKNAIDIGFLLFVPWVTYSVVEYDVDKLIAGTQKL